MNEKSVLSCLNGWEYAGGKQNTSVKLVWVFSLHKMSLCFSFPLCSWPKICSIGFYARTCWGCCSCVRGGGGKVFSPSCPHLTVLLDGVPSCALVPGDITALAPGCCLGPPIVGATQLWCGSAGGISDTAPLSKAHSVCAVQGWKMMGNWGKCTAARVLKVMFLQSPRAQAVTCGQRQKGRSKFHTSLGHLKSICCCCKFTPKMVKPVASGSPASSEGRKKKDNIYVNLTLAENISFMFLASQKPPDTLALLHQGPTWFDFAFRWNHNISQLHSQGRSPSNL